MPRIPPLTADLLRAAGAVGGIALIVVGTYDTRWVPLLGCLAVVALSTVEFALARMRRWIRDTEARTTRPAPDHPGPGRVPAPGREQVGADALLRLLEAVHHELRHAHAAADRAQAELADLSREWNTLVQESMAPPVDPHARTRPD